MRDKGGKGRGGRRRVERGCEEGEGMREGVREGREGVKGRGLERETQLVYIAQ